jgi:hypothetical protein
LTSSKIITVVERIICLKPQGRSHVIADRDYGWDELQQIVLGRGGIGKRKGHEVLTS